MRLPTDSKERKKYPIYSGVLKYFPRAIAAVARVSYAGNKQHSPGQPLHWVRDKSTDQEDCILRHMVDDIFDPVDRKDEMFHRAKVAWRALASLEVFLEEREKAGIE